MEKKERNIEELEQGNGSSILIGSFIFAGVVCTAAAIYGTISGMN